MSNDKNNLSESKETEQSDKDSQKDSILPVHNPLDPSDDRKITQEDIENLEKYKEALTERD